MSLIYVFNKFKKFQKFWTYRIIAKVLWLCPLPWQAESQSLGHQRSHWPKQSCLLCYSCVNLEQEESSSECGKENTAGGDEESKAHSLNVTVYSPQPPRIQSHSHLPVFFSLSTQISTSSCILVFSHLSSLHCLPSPSGLGQMKCISFLVIVWSVDLCVCVSVCVCMCACVCTARLVGRQISPTPLGFE